MNDFRMKISQSVSTTANAVTGFSIAQNLVVILSIAEQRTFYKMVSADFNLWVILTIGFGCLYLITLWFLHNREKALLSGIDEILSDHATKMFFGRGILVTFVFLLVIYTGCNPPDI